MQSLRHEPERDPRLDGLRALAVISVLLFHLELPFAGGYLGVDIFFVLSGYLIVGCLLRADQLGSKQIGAFYLRRALRLVPSLFAVIAMVVLAAPFVLLPAELSFLGQSILATILMVPNVFFWSSFDYFSTAAQGSPLLHLWSLGVEAQFYLIAPILLLVRRWIGGRWWLWLMAGGIVFSFALSLYASAFHPKAGFYWMPARFWQFGLGAAVALSALQLGRWAGLAGSTLLCGGFGATTFAPFLSGLWVTAGTALIIASPRAGFLARTLGSALLRWIGARAYTLYLVHWPVIVFAMLVRGRDLAGSEKVLLAATSILLAAAVSRWIERPMMGSRSLRPIAAGAVGVLLVGAFLLPKAVWQGAYPQKVTELSAYASYKDWPAFQDQTMLHQCFIIDRTEGGVGAFDEQSCLPSWDGRPQLILIGDSHAAHLSGALRALPDWQVGQVTMAGCRPFILTAPENECAALMARALRDQRPDLWVISARWQADEIEDLSQTLTQLSGRVLVLGPVPEYPGGLPQHLARDARTGRDTAQDRANPKIADLDAELAQALAGSPATYLSILDLLCPKGRCKTKIDGVPFQFDYGHFTAEGATYVVSRLLPYLKPAPPPMIVVQHGRE